MKLSPHRMFRLLLRNGLNDWHLDQLDNVLRPIAQGIDACSKSINRASATGSDEYAEAVAADEYEIAEGLLGAAFVVCQTQIERVVRTVTLVHLHATGLPVQLTKITGTRKGEVMSFGNPRVRRTIVTQVQALNAVANYFKHRESWPGDWKRLIAKKKRTRSEDQAADTMKTLRAIGLRQGSSGNMRRAAKVFGNSTYTDLSPLTNVLRNWQSNIFAAYEAELKGTGLL